MVPNSGLRCLGCVSFLDAGGLRAEVVGPVVLATGLELNRLSSAGGNGLRLGTGQLLVYGLHVGQAPTKPETIERGDMKRLLILLLMVPLFARAAQDPKAVMDEIARMSWTDGPAVGQIGPKATIEIPAGYRFLGEKDTRRFIELAGNPPPVDNYLIAPKDLHWFAVFRFNESGYVKDDEKINPTELLENLKASDEPSNTERKKLGMTALYTDGWAVEPHYDPSTKRLEWGLRLRDENGTMNTNYTSRLLGRSGVMEAILVSGVDTLTEDTAQFKIALANFSYAKGETYAEFKAGDKVAEFGLAALVLGGAAAVATKKGLWAVIGGFIAAFWKVLVGVVVAGLVALRGLFKKKL